VELRVPPGQWRGRARPDGPREADGARHGLSRGRPAESGAQRAPHTAARAVRGGSGDGHPQRPLCAGSRDRRVPRARDLSAALPAIRRSSSGGGALPVLALLLWFKLGLEVQSMTGLIAAGSAMVVLFGVIWVCFVYRNDPYVDL